MVILLGEAGRRFRQRLRLALAHPPLLFEATIIGIALHSLIQESRILHLAG